MPSAVIQSPGGCQCGGGGGCASPTIHGKVTGCGGLNIQGATVTAHDATAGGASLGSTTTNSTGDYTLSGLSGQVSGHAIVVVISHARITAANRTLSYAATVGFNTQWGCGQTTATDTTGATTPAAGYHCTGQCGLPIKDTLTLTDSVYGGATLTYNATFDVWTGSAGATFGGTGPPCGTCAGSAVTIFYTLDAALMQLQVTVTAGGAPDCPWTGPGAVGALPVGLTGTCPPSFSESGTIPDTSWSAAIIQQLYQCSPVTFTVSE